LHTQRKRAALLRAHYIFMPAYSKKSGLLIFQKTGVQYAGAQHLSAKAGGYFRYICF
jgi:hypothetical protein